MSTLPPRCFTCGKVLRWTSYKKKVYIDLVQKNVALDELDYSRMCCRRMLLAHNPLIEENIELYSRGTPHT